MGNPHIYGPKSHDRQGVTVHPLARHADLISQPVGDEVMIYDLTRDKGHLLNATAMMVWRLCDGRTPPAAMAAQLHAQTQVAVADCDALVALALDRLVAAHLLEPASWRANDARGLTRRSVLKRVGVASLLPVIYTLTAPTAAQAQSADCSACNGTTCPGAQQVKCACPGGGCVCRGSTTACLAQGCTPC